MRGGRHHHVSALWRLATTAQGFILISCLEKLYFDTVVFTPHQLQELVRL
jgi:hypothetical protein